MVYHVINRGLGNNDLFFCDDVTPNGFIAIQVHRIDKHPDAAEKP
jgi:hypothetical protein